MLPAFEKGRFNSKFMGLTSYCSKPVKPGFFGRLLPSLSFYGQLLVGPMRWLSLKATRGQCEDTAWVYASLWVTDIIEKLGCPISVEGLQHIDALDGPCLFVANHMSTLETFMLPGIIRPRRPVTFVVKKSLTTMPVFGPIMRSRDPIVVGRSNPREDLTAVLEGGVERLRQGTSIIVFPQSTRSLTFDPHHFNTIGVKLARKAGVPIVPLALKTDAWGQGHKIKELGSIKAGLPVRYRFEAPVTVQGNGKEDHAAIADYIGSTLARWQKEDGINA